MSEFHILAVEDEPDILELVTYNLKKAGYKVSGVGNGEDALRSANSLRPDLILLDLMLPGMDGLEVCKRIKEDPEISKIAILMLTAKGGEEDIVKGLEIGADDYLTKPFSPKVLVARVKALLRRKSAEPAGTALLKLGRLSMAIDRHEAKIDEQLLDLTSGEFRLLYYLASNPGVVFTRQQIVKAVHGENYPVTDRSVDVQVVGLRRKMGELGAEIETVRGVGYRYRDRE